MSSARSFKIPIVDLRAQYAKIRAEVNRAIAEVNDSQQFILGPTVEHFERQMAGYLHGRFALGVASGSDALLLALMALGVGAGDAVITTPFTFFSTVSAIVRLGAQPLFVDIDAESCLISSAQLKEFLAQHARVDNDRTLDARTGVRIRAILPVHLFGQCCAMNELSELAQNFGLRMVEDVAQACGARMTMAGTEKFAGTIGDLGCFSFFPSKNLGAFGDAGLITSQDEELYETINVLRVHGERAKYFHEKIGINSRLDSLQAAVLSIKQLYLDQWCEQRIKRATTYHELFVQTGILESDSLDIPPVPRDKSHVFNSYVVRAKRRDELKQFLAENGIQSEIYYPLPLHLQPCFASLGYQKGDFPSAEKQANHVLALPIYPELTLGQQELVVEKICRFYGL